MCEHLGSAYRVPLCPHHLLAHLTLPETLLAIRRVCFTGEN